MRRIPVLFLTLFFLFALIPGVHAASSASMIGTYATVSADGSCQVTMTVRLHLEQTATNLTYPIPRQASAVTLNGTRVRTQTKNDAQLIDLSDALGTMIGDITLTVSYTLNNAVSLSDANLLTLQIPLLSGFSYPVDALEFSVTLPGVPEAKPAFSSGYHQSNIEKDLTYSISGATISGSSQKELKDHETLVLTLQVSEAMFPQNRMELPDLQVVHMAMGVCGLLALLYWLITLRCAPLRHKLSPLPPEGCTAGTLGSALTLEGADLTMMVFTWAQLGYLLIHLDRHDRVTLYKRMDMGNERSSFERRCYQQLFGKRNSVDTSGQRYGQLWENCRKSKPPIQSFLRPRSGNPRIFRAFASMIGLFGGISLGISLSTGAALQWLLVCILAAMGTVSSLYMQRFAYCLFFLDKRNLWSALLQSGIWILLSLIAGTPAVGILVSASQLLAGLMAAYGGRRTDAGRQTCQQILGLRRYLCNTPQSQLLQLLEKDPDYFYALAPYALALGVDMAFAKRFGKTRLAPCPYLRVGTESHMPAADWAMLMRRAVHSMNANQEQRFSRKLLPILRNMLK